MLVRFAKVVALFVLLTVVMTWPQAARLTTDAWPHEDVFFNMWRIGWVAHALPRSPTHVLDGNIFYPELRTLTLSDAVLVESLLAAPMLWMGVPIVLVHNIVLLAGIILSAAGVWLLVVTLTGSATAAITAGIVFAFVPYRFDHYMHLELQWTVWIPWTFWAMHKVFETGAIRHAVLLGVFIALQFMSSVYYGLFLVTLLPVGALLLLCGTRPGEVMRGLRALALAAGTAALLTAPYLFPYATTRHDVGPRPEEQIAMFSARPSSYRATTETNYLYGERTVHSGRGERRLFPGVLPLLLAVVGLLLYPASKEAIVYLVTLAIAFDMSFGLKGYTFSFLYQHVPAFDGLRAPARVAIFVIFCLSVLAAFGQSALEKATGKRLRRGLIAAIPAVLLLEYWVAPLPLTAYPSAPSPLYAWLAKQPAGVVAEFPMPRPNGLPSNEARFAFMSTFHWMPLINGYSGYYPATYLNRLERLSTMPDAAALENLVGAGVRYVIVHVGLYRPGGADEVIGALSGHSRFRELGRFNDGIGEAVVFSAR
ncbi:MAG TPA: hypothetical protein VFT39_22165 [Vicinamibacterales bacterium]|nr:hypothetical protein [Vicinamibacterales bacterium]